MKQKFLKDIGIDIDDETKDLIKQFDLTGYMDQISDDRLKEEDKAVEEAATKIQEQYEECDSDDGEVIEASAEVEESNSEE